MSLSLEIANSGMQLLANLGQAGMLESSGVSREDFKRLVSPLPWLSPDRNRMTATLHTMIVGSTDALGLPRFPLPAEYIAAGIVMFVSPTNIHAACTYMARSHDAETMARQINNSQVALPEPVNPERLFALVVQLYGSTSRSAARVLFEKNTGLSLDFALESPQDEVKTKR